MGNFTYSVVPVSVIKVKIPVPFFFFRLSVQFNKMKVTLSFYTMDLKVVTERYMYTFRPMVECQKINIYFFYHHALIYLQHVNFSKGRKNILMLSLQNMGQSNPAYAIDLRGNLY